MITKDDCLSILVEMDDNGIDTKDVTLSLMSSRNIPVDVLKFIAKNRGFVVADFYEVLRKSHNKNKSPLYTNILKEIEDPEEITTTLSSMLTQILLYGRKLDKDRDLFYRQIRAAEITEVLKDYFETGITDRCEKLLKFMKSDLLVMEYISGRRELQEE